MATASKTGPQDMPPSGGYGPIQWQRVPLKRVFNVPLTVGIYVVVTAIGITGYQMARKKYKREDLEMRSARHAIVPFLIAERDRAFLKQVRVNRDIERELMKNVPEWEVGTYFGEPVYITLEDKFVEPRYYEYMAHADFCDMSYKLLRRHFT